MSKSADAFRTISEVAEWLDTPAHVLRFWEARFKEISPIKRGGGRRFYRPEDMLLLGGIKHLLHEKGLTIKAVQDILASEGNDHVAGLSPLSLTGEATPKAQSTAEEKRVDAPTPAVEVADTGAAEHAPEAPFIEAEPEDLPPQKSAEIVSLKPPTAPSDQPLAPEEAATDEITAPAAPSEDPAPTTPPLQETAPAPQEPEPLEEPVAIDETPVEPAPVAKAPEDSTDIAAEPIETDPPAEDTPLQNKRPAIVMTPPDPADDADVTPINSALDRLKAQRPTFEKCPAQARETAISALRELSKKLAG
ncbi:MAG: MerR family transcriptional regulator [Halocynthiibacter sp.]